jgi:hypothetical protein
LARIVESPGNTREVLERLEESIETLRVAYEKYFSGVERKAPARLRQKVERQVRLVESMPIRTTALRFMVGGLKARFVTYKHYWTRVERELERGMSRRDLLRIRRGLGAPKPPSKEPAPELSALEKARQEIAAATAQPSPTNGKSTVPPPPPTGKLARRASVGGSDTGLDAAHMRDVFKQLVRAKKAAGESTDGLTYAALCRKLSREVPKLRQKHKCEQVRFEVQTVQGKVRLRARPDSAEAG